MRVFPVAALVWVGALWVWPDSVCGQGAAISEREKIAARQPAALQVKLILAKNKFFVGEKIEAALEFSNSNEKAPYSLMVGAGAPGAIFQARDEKGALVPDSLQWRNDWYPQVVTGPVGIHVLGKYSLEMTVNKNLYFGTGVYALYARSTVFKGSSFEEKSRVELVSNEVSFVVLPPTPEQEKESLTEAIRNVGGEYSTNDGLTREGIEQLSCLQTAAAQAELIHLLARPSLTWLAGEGLLAAANPLEVANLMLKRVKEGKWIPDQGGLEIYGMLKSSVVIRDISPVGLPEKEVEARFDKLRKARKSARDELLQATKQASRGQGEAYIEALWTAFLEIAIYKNPGDQDSDGGSARRELAEHQLELSEKHVQELLQAWSSWGSADFLPLLRREAGAPHHQFIALIALAGIKPDEARPMIIAEMSRPDSRFFKGSYPASTLLPKIPPLPLPQFDSLFRKKLAEAKGNAFPIVPVIACFGSPGLLPDVVKSWQLYGRGPKDPWDHAILHGLFLYWLRVDPKGGAAALQQEIQSQGKEGGAFLLNVLRDPWLEEGMPVLQWALVNPDPILISSGVYLLEKHGDRSSIDPILETLERLQKSEEGKAISLYQSGQLLKSQRWRYTETQKKRLEALTSVTASK